MKKTVIISCAGVGSRLGLNIPKCLVEINNKSLLEFQLEQLQDVDVIRVVVGYKKDLVIDKIKTINKNVKIIENKDYEVTGTAGSFWCAIDGTEHPYVIALDGDLIVNPIDMQKLLSSEEELICGEEKNTEDPVLITLDDKNRVIKFSRDEGEYEWAGLAQIKKENLVEGLKHIYQILEPLLPIKFQLIRAKEIDTPSDLKEAEEWVNKNFGKKDIMDGWFKSRFAIENNYEASRHAINNRLEFDMNLINQYIDKESRILDLGCGTGVLEEQLAKKVKYIKAIDKYQEFLQRAKNLSNVEYEKHNVESYYDEKEYDLIMLFGVTIYLFDEELENTIKNCLLMMHDNSILIIKNKWALSDDDYIIDKEYSKTNKNRYYCIYRSLEKMKKLLERYGLSYEIVDIYPSDMNLYQDTPEYALICKKNNKNI